MNYSEETHCIQTGLRDVQNKNGEFYKLKWLLKIL